MQDRLVLADSAYGDAYEFCQGLRERKLDYVVQVSGELTPWTELIAFGSSDGRLFKQTFQLKSEGNSPDN